MIFNGLSWKQIKQTFLEDDSLTLIMKILELHKAQREILQNIKKALHVIKELIRSILN